MLSKLSIPTRVRLGWLAAAGASVIGCAAPPAQTPAVSAASAAAPAPAAARPAVPPDPAVLGVWKIEQARAAPLLHKLNARLDFAPDGRLVGNGGCNGITGAYTLQGNRLALGPLATTRKACNEVLMEQEDRVLSALERAVTARVPPHGLLELLDADGTVLLRGSRLPPASAASAPPAVQ
jgi:heat shock protein HslJ